MRGGHKTPEWFCIKAGSSVSHSKTIWGGHKTMSAILKLWGVVTRHQNDSALRLAAVSVILKLWGAVTRQSSKPQLLKRKDSHNSNPSNTHMAYYYTTIHITQAPHSLSRGMEADSYNELQTVKLHKEPRAVLSVRGYNHHDERFLSLIHISEPTRR